MTQTINKIINGAVIYVSNSNSLVGTLVKAASSGESLNKESMFDLLAKIPDNIEDFVRELMCMNLSTVDKFNCTTLQIFLRPIKTIFAGSSIGDSILAIALGWIDDYKMMPHSHNH